MVFFRQAGRLVGAFLLGLAFLLPHAWALEPARELDTAQLAETFFALISQDTPWPAEDLQVDGFSASPSTLTVPGGTLTFHPLNQSHSDYLGKKRLLVAVVVDGREEARVSMTGQLRLFGEVVVAARRMSRHTVLGPDDLQVVRRDISQMASDLLHAPEEAVGLRLTTALQAGASLFASMVEASPLVRRGDLVTILAESGSISVRVPGEMRGGGAKGDSVRVKNLLSRREIYAVVVDEKTVRVAF